MAKFVPLMVGLLLFGLFAVALINFDILMAANNNPNQTIGNDPAISAYSGNLTQTLMTDYDNSVSADAGFSNSSIQTTTAVPYVSAVGGIWKTLRSAPVAIYNLTFGLIFGKILGAAAQNIVTAVLAAIAVLAIISAVVLFIMWGQGG